MAIADNNSNDVASASAAATADTGTGTASVSSRQSFLANRSSGIAASSRLQRRMATARDTVEESGNRASEGERCDGASVVLVDRIANLKYIEFRDSRVDWTNTDTRPLERELYDQDEDPYEMCNLIAKASAPFLKALEEKTKRLIACRGATCRAEHSTGLDNY